MPKPEIKIEDYLLDRELLPEQSIQMEPVMAMSSYLDGLLNHEADTYDRQRAAFIYADFYRQELPTDTTRLDYEQQSAIEMTRVFLSSVASNAQLRRFITSGIILGQNDQYTLARKRMYLEARKAFQDDVDRVFDHYQYLPNAMVGQSLTEVVTMSRQVLRANHRPASSLALGTYFFLGSVMSERAVKVSLQENISAGTRYSTALEDSRPYKADVVVPLPEGNMPVQVKMKIAEDAEFAVRPFRKTPHVFMPMPMPTIRTELNGEEDEHLALSIIEATEKGQWQPLQTGVDELQLAA